VHPLTPMRVLLLASVLVAASACGSSHPRARNGAIAFLTDRGGGSWAAYVTNATGTRTRRIAATTGPDTICTGALRWSRDGEHLAYTGAEYGLRTYDARTGRARNVVPDGNSCDEYGLSPDGRGFAFTTMNGVSAEDAARGVYTLFAGAPGDSGAGVAWSPDGKQIAYIRGGGEQDGLDVATADGKTVKNVAPNVAFGVQPVWSPDSRKLAYVAQPETGVNGFVEVVDASGKHRHRLAPRRQENQVLDWSPNGRQVIWSGSDHGTFIADADGSQLHRVSSADATSISWSPDGRLIAYTAGKPAAAWLMNADGTHAHVLPLDLPYGGDVASIAWNPAGLPVTAIAGKPVHTPRSELGIPTGPLVAFSASTGLPVQGFPKVSAGSVSAIAADGAGGWFVGGDFTTVGGLACKYLAHVRADLHLDRRFCSKPNGEVQALARLGSTLYVGGPFDHLAGTSRVSFGAIDIRSGKATSWQPLKGLPSPLRSDKGLIGLAATRATVYLLGPFGRVGGAARVQLAAVDPVSAGVQPWNPKAPMVPVGLHVETTIDHVVLAANAVYAGSPYGELSVFGSKSGEAIPWAPTKGLNVVWAIAVSGDRLYLGGRFSEFDSAPRHNLAAVDATTRALSAWTANETQPVGLLGASSSALWAAVGVNSGSRIDGFDATTGRPLPAHLTVRGGHAATIAASPAMVLVGGDFNAASFG
jgi:Tol biopolymer transport system component